MKICFLAKIGGAKRIVFALSLLSFVFPTPAAAVEKAFNGQGFDCYFQTGKQNLEHLSFWYGGVEYKNIKVPHLTDPSKLFALGGLSEGSRMQFYVSDKWPEKFELQYFQLEKSKTPLSLLAIEGEEGSESFRAEIIRLPSNVVEGMSVKPIGKLSGRCSTVVEVTYSAFKASVQ